MITFGSSRRRGETRATHKEWKSETAWCGLQPRFQPLAVILVRTITLIDSLPPPQNKQGRRADGRQMSFHLVTSNSLNRSLSSLDATFGSATVTCVWVHFFIQQSDEALGCLVSVCRWIHVHVQACVSKGDGNMRRLSSEFSTHKRKIYRILRVGFKYRTRTKLLAPSTPEKTTSPLVCTLCRELRSVQGLTLSSATCHF